MIRFFRWVTVTRILNTAVRFSKIHTLSLLLLVSKPYQDPLSLNYAKLNDDLPYNFKSISVQKIYSLPSAYLKAKHYLNHNSALNIYLYPQNIYQTAALPQTTELHNVQHPAHLCSAFRYAVSSKSHLSRGMAELFEFVRRPAVMWRVLLSGFRECAV